MPPNQTTLKLGPDAPFSSDPRRNPFAALDDDTPNPDFDRLIANAMDYWHTPGLSIAVIDNSRVISRGYGSAKLPLEEPVTPKTLFNCASMSKSFTSASVALLVEDEGLKDVSWQTPVSQLCDEFVFADKAMTENVTGEDILSHRSGLPSHDEALRSIHHKTPDTPATVTRNLRNLPFSHPLRTHYQYNNTLYTAASHLVTTLSDVPFDESLAKRFWEPLAMTRTFLGPESIPASEQRTAAQGYVWLHEKSEYHVIPHEPDPSGTGAGQIMSSVEDWARWVHAFIHHSPILTEASYKELKTPRILAEQDVTTDYLSPWFYALGWETSYYHGHTIVKHDGLWAGFGSVMLYIPILKWGYVMMGNSEDAGLAMVELGYQLIDQVLRIPDEKRFNWRAYLSKDMEEGRKVASKEGLYPELAENPVAADGEKLDLARFGGRYSNEGYHEIVLDYDAEAQYLVADCSDRT
ncbi:beta-lactamase/transpeptidase-like protein, partial [Lentithecium fluviatile CBS 122367]